MVKRRPSLSVFPLSVKASDDTYLVQAVTAETRVQSILCAVQGQGGVIGTKRLIFNGYRLNNLEMLGDVGIGPGSTLLLEHPAGQQGLGEVDYVSTDSVVTIGIGEGNFFGSGESVVLRMSSAPTEKMLQRREEAELRAQERAQASMSSRGPAKGSR
uniref:Ubiquitin-like domain-containing protein n=1 Tax=Alexandrium catenella TaxID=2925 RepID=A0A7S1SA63_ALECA|mmetsp:Transcript_92527/g.245773  ORF Transcript_92527/g.245773 Transcript_92527/m.245773 type:complete len:157 (+) Transcript_92527:116-586(+)|eukprot:UN2613